LTCGRRPHTKAQITASGKNETGGVAGLDPAIFTFGATPTMPIPFEAAAIVPAVCVPWPLSSWAAVPARGAAHAVGAFATSMFATRSGA